MDGALVASIHVLQTILPIVAALEKLGPLRGLRAEVRELRGKLIYIWGAIKDADKKHTVDEMRWVKDLMNIAYQIEDVVDDYYLEIPEYYGGVINRLKALTFSKKVKEKIKDINDRLDEICKYRKNSIFEDIGGSNTQPRDLWQPNPRSVHDRHDDISECYYSLPFDMKLCFLYFAAFPEDFEIEARALIRIWVAERLIPHEEGRTLEETAERFLEDLGQSRSMVQVSHRFPDGSIKYCRVIDAVKDFAVQKSNEINFLVVCAKPDDWEICCNAPRVAVHYSNDNEPMDTYASPNVRSLLFFGKSLKVDCSKYRMLRVLGNMGGEVILQSFSGLPHLRYLQLNTGLKERDFGEWISGMKNLETLDLRKSMHDDLSNWIWQIKTLRNVLLSEYYGETQGPLEAIYLDPQTITGVSWNKSWETSLAPSMKDLRELSILIYREPERVDAIIARFLNNLKHVVYLKIQGVINLPKIAMGGFPFYENLKSLVLINDDYNTDYTLVLGDDMLPPNLTELELGFEFGSDPMPVLEKLGSLNTLRIRGMRERKNPLRSIRCSAGGFKQLEELVLESLRLKEWKIEMGAMPKLKRLNIRCPLLRVPPGLMHLNSLQSLTWTTIKSSLCFADWDAIRNIFKQRPQLRGWLKDEFGDFISFDSF